MSPGLNPTNEILYEMVKGNIFFNGIHINWDFTNGLTKEQFVRKIELEELEMVVCKNGRILIPSMGIN